MAASLTTVAITTRRVIRYTFFLIIFITFGRIILNLGLSIYRKAHPTPPPPPTLLFGKLPSLPFPENSKELPKLTYTVETASGDLPRFSEQEKIYFMPSSGSANLFTKESTKTRAASLGFTGNPIEISPTQFLFHHPRLPSTLELNSVSGIFSISYDLAADKTILGFRSIPPDNAIQQVRDYLGGSGSSPSDLNGPAVPELLTLENQKLVTANSLSEAQFIKVSLYRKDFNSIPAVGSDPNQANVWFLVSGSPDPGKRVFAGQYHYFPMEETRNATYPIKKTQETLDDLTAGNAFIASLGENPDGKITIRKIYLAYYDSGVPMKFYQPIAVFEGDRGFVAYVPAVNKDYYGDNTNQN